MITRWRHDVIVVGGGHAGIEAALAAARLGCRTALVSHERAEIGRMPCNPSIGGLGKGHLVRELDVLGGQMGLTIDATGIQFRTLNRRKGPAVQAPRAQADKHRYQAAMLSVIEAQAGLDLFEGDVVGLQAEPGGAIAGVVLQDGHRLSAPRVVLCTGTFLCGLMHVGAQQIRGGRSGAASSEGLSEELRRLGFVLRRLKTGTPPRLRAGSIDFAELEVQPGDADARPFSFRTRAFVAPDSACWLTHTTAETHAIIIANLSKSPLYAGIIEGRGPRYCPSIEDKVVRFADRPRHLLFLEPEGLDSDEIYVSGLSTSLPPEIQEAVVHSVTGLERAEIVRYGYAVEYDSVPSWQVKPSLASKAIAGLYLAGQILGTSGYEEAAVQGLLAGINAARSLMGRDPWLPARDQAYIGVLIDDLVTKEITEPYRMFTSRAENRLHLRCDNAEMRLLDAASTLGLLTDGDLECLRARDRARRRTLQLLEDRRFARSDDGTVVRAAELLKQPRTELVDLVRLLAGGAGLLADIEQVLAEELGAGPSLPVAAGVIEDCVNTIKYRGYIDSQQRRLAELTDLDRREIPEGFCYDSLTALSFEAREKLGRMRPATVGQAGRIDGVRAGDLAVLTVALKRQRLQEQNIAKEGNPA